MVKKTVGMAVAKERALEAAKNGVEPSACPYKDRHWKSAWLRALYSFQQLRLPGL